jgi:Glutathione-dependent formaldehyde-activating enzyme
MPSSAPRDGGCSCRAVRYRLTSEPFFTHCCHCVNCQRQTGSAFVINLLIEADRVQLLAGAPHPVEAPRDDGSKQLIFRCPTSQVRRETEASYFGRGSSASRGGCRKAPGLGRYVDRSQRRKTRLRVGQRFLDHDKQPLDPVEQSILRARLDRAAGGFEPSHAERRTV